MLYFAACIVVVGILFGLLPFATNIYLFFIDQFLAGLFFGLFNAVNIAHFVYTMGPIVSRPFTMAIHLLVGIGFFAGSLLGKSVRSSITNAEKPLLIIAIKIEYPKTNNSFQH